MWTLLLVVFITGSPAVLRAAPVQGFSSGCSFAGVLHVEGTSPYSLTFQQASQLCQSLGHKLATQENVIEAYKKGLRMCRYGWIDGQNIMFVPHVNGTNCESGSTEVTFRPEADEYLSDVYCFNPSNSTLNCEDTVTFIPDTWNGNAATADGKPHEDILKEVKTEGFLVDLEEILERVKTETSSLSDMEAPKTYVFPDVDVKPPTLPTLEEPTTTNHNEDHEGPTSKSFFGKGSFTISPSVLFSDTEGSGSGSINEILFEKSEPSQFTVRSITTEEAVDEPVHSNVEEPPIEVSNKARKVNVGAEVNRDPFTNPSLPPGSSGQKTDGPSTWLAIFAFCVVVGAVVCLLIAIATRDKWYGPRKSRNITEVHKDYSKTETLPLSEKEQEIVALMSVANMKNGKMEDINGTNLDEHEREYLM